MNAKPSTPNRSPKIMNQNQTESKPASEEQPTDERLDGEDCSVSSYLESLNERAAEWESWGEGRLDGYRAGYADALRKVSEELRSFSENSKDIPHAVSESSDCSKSE